MSYSRAILALATKGTSLIILSAILLSGIAETKAATLSQQKQAAKKKAAALSSQAARASAKVYTIQSALNHLNSQIYKLQSQTYATNRKITSTRSNIQATNHQIKIQQSKLSVNQKKQGEVLQALYLIEQKNVLESFVSGNSMSDMFAHDQYTSNLEKNIHELMVEDLKLKAQLVVRRKNLSTQQQELLAQKKQQQLLQANVNKQRQQQYTLLYSAQSQKRKILASLSQAQSEITRLSAAEQASHNRYTSSHSGSITHSGSSYPYKGMYNPEVVDPWGFYTTECVSYAAWYWNTKLGKHWRNTRPGMGSAKYWTTLARDQGYSVGSQPRAGAIITWFGGAYGHVAIVEAVNSDGTVNISDYNYSPHTYNYTTHVNPSQYMRGGHSYIY